MFVQVEGYFIEPPWVKGTTVSKDTGGYNIYL